MRGYSFRAVGPLHIDQNRSFHPGGMSKIYSTIELEYPLMKEANIKGVVFMDGGNVYRTNFPQSTENLLRYDYGYGFRWFSPVGVLRFEFAHPINPKPFEDSGHFFFDIGQLF